MNNGIIYSAYGDSAIGECLKAIESLRVVHGKTYPVAVATNQPDRFHKVADKIVVNDEYSDPYGRIAKLNADRWTPFKNTLYLDADTRVFGDISPIFDCLDSGFEFACTISERQGDEWLWHLPIAERLEVNCRLGYTPTQIQGGVFAFRKTNPARKFFGTWRRQYADFESHYDQGALAIAFNEVPMKTAFLSSIYNGGMFIAHRFGVIQPEVKS